MRRVFVYEYLSGGGSVDDDSVADDLLQMGAAMRDAMVLDLLCIEHCAVSVATCARAPIRLAGVGALSPGPAESPRRFVERQARRHDAVWLVAPETSGLLAGLSAAVEPSRSLGCEPGAIVLASSKQATVEHLAACGLATPLACADDPGVRRWVVKPDDGVGAVDARVHDELEAARRDQRARGSGSAAGWLEPWVDGEALSVSMLCGGGRATLLSLNRQHISVGRDGALHFDGVDVNVMPAGDPRRPVLAALAGRVAAAIPGLRGFVGIDLVWHAQRGPVVIEVNPRVTSAYVGLSASLGRNIAAELLAWPRTGAGDA